MANLASGALVGRFGSRPPMILGALVDAVGFALLLRLDGASAYSAMLLPFALMPAGMGTGIPAATVAVLASVEKERTGIASAVFNAARQAAGAMGVAVFGAFAGGGRPQIVSGLHRSAFVAVVLLAGAALLAACAVPKRAVAPSGR